MPTKLGYIEKEEKSIILTNKNKSRELCDNIIHKNI